MNSSLVTISYDEESVTFAESGGGELVVREYMGENRSAYQAKIERSGNQLYISEGGRPIFAGSFHRYIEVSLPDGYANSLTVTTCALTVLRAQSRCRVPWRIVYIYPLPGAQ